MLSLCAVWSTTARNPWFRGWPGLLSLLSILVLAVLQPADAGETGPSSAPVQSVAVDAAPMPDSGREAYPPLERLDAEQLVSRVRVYDRLQRIMAAWYEGSCTTPANGTGP